MKFLRSSTAWGLVLAGLLVLLFYSLTLSEARDSLATTARKKAADKAKERLHERQETTQHQELVEALRTRTATSTGPATSAAKPTANQNSYAAPATADSTKARATPAATVPATGRGIVASTPTHDWRQLTWALPVLLALGLSLIGYFGWQGWRESTVTFEAANPHDLDTPLLEAWLSAFAETIGQVLPGPRQVKRFASKARLQHNLLHQLAREQLDFPFASLDQVTALLVLLLLARPNCSVDSSSTATFADSLQTCFSTWAEAAGNQAQYQRFFATMNKPELAFDKLLAHAGAPETAKLFAELYQLNTGLLV